MMPRGGIMIGRGDTEASEQVVKEEEVRSAELAAENAAN
jgi:hypothetical protein